MPLPKRLHQDHWEVTMAPNPKILAAACVCVILGFSETLYAAATQINNDLDNGTISVVDADALWNGSLVEFRACTDAGKRTCLNAFIDPDQLVKGQVVIEFDSGRLLPSDEIDTFGSGFRVRQLSVLEEEIDSHREALAILDGDAFFSCIAVERVGKIRWNSVERITSKRQKYDRVTVTGRSIPDLRCIFGWESGIRSISNLRRCVYFPFATFRR